jgi:large subunit ribosomal protein L23
MELSIYDIIQGPVVSDKAYKLNQSLNKLVVYVHPEANKPLVSEAIEKLFDVKVSSVRIMVRKGKRRMSKARKIVIDKTTKRAVITLKDGYNVNLFGDIVERAQGLSSSTVKSDETTKASGE